MTRAFLLGVAACTSGDPATPEADRDPCPRTPGVICTWAGVPEVAMFSAEGLHRLDAALFLPMDMTLGPDGRAWLLDSNNHRVRVVDPTTDAVTTISGTGFLGDGPPGPALDFTWNHPTDLAFHPLDDRKLWVAAWHNSRVNVVDIDRRVADFACGDGTRRFAGDGGPASGAAFDLPSSVTFEPDGTMYVSDTANQVIRRVDTAGVITSVIGRVETRELDRDANPETPPYVETRGWEGYGGDGGPASEARLRSARGAGAMPGARITIHDRRLWFVDTDNHLVRAVDLDTWQIDRVAGRVETRDGFDHDGDPSTPPVALTQGWPGFEGEGTPALDAVFNHPRDIEVDAEGNLFIADTDNHCVRKIDTAGIITTVAGVCGAEGFEGDGGPATEARLRRPFGVEVAPDGRLFIADFENQVFRVVHP